MNPRMRQALRAPVIGTAMLVGLLSLSACSSNDGGATSCSDYLGLSSSERTDVIKKFLDENGDSGAGSVKTGLTKASVLAYCNTVGGGSDPISNVNG